MKRLLLALLACGAVAPAGAAEQIAITVRVGETVATDVGYAMGFLCDDNRIVHGEMRNKTAETNEFVITGLAVGVTLCRTGTTSVDDRWTFLFEVTVIPADDPVAFR